MAKANNYLGVTPSAYTFTGVHIHDWSSRDRPPTVSVNAKLAKIGEGIVAVALKGAYEQHLRRINEQGYIRPFAYRLQERERQMRQTREQLAQAVALRRQLENQIVEQLTAGADPSDAEVRLAAAVGEIAVLERRVEHISKLTAQAEQDARKEFDTDFEDWAAERRKESQKELATVRTDLEKAISDHLGRYLLLVRAVDVLTDRQLLQSLRGTPVDPGQQAAVVPGWIADD